MKKNRHRYATTHDVARAAGVSLATVDRVLNGRSGVRHETRERVEAAVKHLDFRRDARAANLAKSRTYRFLFVLPSRESAFAQSLEQAVENAALASVAERVVIAIEKVDLLDPAALIATLKAINPENWDGVAVKATDAPGVREALDDLIDQGLSVVTMVSDIPSSKRQFYAGIDNTAAGRVAGSLMGRFLQGKQGVIGVIAGSLMVRDHVERRLGLEQVLKTEYPDLTLLPVAESGDDGEAIGKIVECMLDAHPDLLGIYSISGGNQDILDVLKTRKPKPRPILIVHDLPQHTRQALLEGHVDAAIHQDLDKESQSALRALIALADNSLDIGGQNRIQIGIFLRDNLP